MARTVDEMEEAALRWAFGKVRRGEGFSLVGCALQSDGELAGVFISAESDQEMFEDAERELRALNASAFSLLGTGHIDLPHRSLDVFVRYSQRPGEERVQASILPYAWDGDDLTLEHWYERGPLGTSWIASEPLSGKAR